MNSTDLITLLKKHGWSEVRCKGSHHQFRHPDKKLPITVPHPRKDLPIGTLKKILKDAGLK